MDLTPIRERYAAARVKYEVRDFMVNDVPLLFAAIEALQARIVVLEVALRGAGIEVD